MALVGGRRHQLKLGRSRVHAWGLFAVDPIEPEQFVIEYVGEVISSARCDLRETKYERSGKGKARLHRPIHHNTPHGHRLTSISVGIVNSPHAMAPHGGRSTEELRLIPGLGVVT